MIIDKVTLDRIETAHPLVRFELSVIYAIICEKVNSKYCQVRFTWVYRSSYEQDQLYKKGRELPGIKVTNAKAGQSYHNYGLAVDICLLIDRDRNGTFEEASWSTVFDGNNNGVADWLEVAKIFQKYGWQWGLINSKGKRYDLPHFQKTFGYKPWQLKRMKRDYENYPIIKNVA
jgi:peptidoglycan L-alanyl-D-glutamate endopeptidase CwlK